MARKSKHKHLSKLYKTDRVIGLSLLVLGGILLLTSLLINIVFIRGTNFREQYLQHQHEDCLQKGNSLERCGQDYPI